MGKPVDQNDSTMDISASQFVAEPPPKPKPQAGRANPQNDMSVWKQVVVGTDDFAPAPAQRSGKRRGLVIGTVAALAIAGGGVAIWQLMSRAEPSTTPAGNGPVEATKPTPPPAQPAAAAVAPSEPPPEVPQSLEPAPPEEVVSVVDILASVLPEPGLMSMLDILFAALPAPGPAVATKAPAKKVAVGKRKPIKKKPPPRRRTR